MRASTVSLLLGLAPAGVFGQGVASPSRPAAPPPATQLEAFHPDAGSVTTLGYTSIGRVGGASVEVRELRGSRGKSARGLLVEVTESQYREERSFIDTDEVAELLKGIDVILDVKANPTKLTSFQVDYTTKGELEVSAFSSGRGIQYGVRAGRALHATTFLDEKDMRRFRELIVTANENLKALAQ